MQRSENAHATDSKHSTQGRPGNQMTWHFRGDWEFKLKAEFAGFLSEVFVDLFDGVKIRTPASREPRFKWEKYSDELEKDVLSLMLSASLQICFWKSLRLNQHKKN